MNDEPNIDPELRGRLHGARRELTGDRPRADARIESMVGAGPPSTTHPGPPADVDPTEEMPVVTPLGNRPRRSRLAGVVAAAAAAVLLVGGGMLALQAGSSPTVDSEGDAAAAPAKQPRASTLLRQQDEPDSGDADGGGEADPADGPADDSPADGMNDLDAHREWIECVMDEIHSMFEGGERPADALSECGEPPVLDRSDLWPVEECPDPEGIEDNAAPGWWCTWDFDELDLDLDEWELPDFDLDEWELPDLDLDHFGLDGFDLDGLCEGDESDDGASLRCAWPPCADADLECPTPEPCGDPSDDADDGGGGDGPGFCFGFHFGFEFGAEGGGFPFVWPDGEHEWPEWIPDDADHESDAEA